MLKVAAVHVTAASKNSDKPPRCSEVKIQVLIARGLKISGTQKGLEEE